MDKACHNDWIVLIKVNELDKTYHSDWIVLIFLLMNLFSN